MTEVTEAPNDFESQVELLDTKEVEVTLKHPITGEEKTFIQKELAFIPKTKLLSLVATTLRAASDADGNIGDLVNDMFGGVNDLISQGVDPEDAESFATNQFLDVILRLVEITPDFLDRLYVLLLNVKGKDTQWVIDSLEVMEDEQGFAILHTGFVQNGPALRDFFGKHLRVLATQVQEVLGMNQETENPEDTEQA